MWSRTFLFLVMALSAAAILLLLPAHAAGVRKTALVIGNAEYPDAPLSNPVHDAADIGRELEALGFRVVLVTNGTRRRMEEAVRELSRQLADGGVGLFYYAGHGIQVNGENFLIPVDARIETEADVRYEAVSAGRILDHLKLSGNRMNIVILDACRNNPFARGFRSDSRGLARMDAPTGSIMAYATAPGSVAADGEGRNGVYTRNLLKAMRTPGLDIYDTFMQVRRGVIRDTQGRQTPWESSSLIGKFYFREKEPEPVAAPAPVPDPETEALKAQLTAMQQQVAALQEQARQNAELARTREPDRSSEELKAQLAAMQEQMAALQQRSGHEAQSAPAPQAGQTEEGLKAQLEAVQQQVASLQQTRVLPGGASLLRTDVVPLTAQKQAKREAGDRLVLSVAPMAFLWEPGREKPLWCPKAQQRVLESLAQRGDVLPVFTPAGELEGVHPYTLSPDGESALWPEGAGGPPDTGTLRLIAEQLHADTLVAVAMEHSYRVRRKIFARCHIYDAGNDSLKTCSISVEKPAFYPLSAYLSLVQRCVNQGLDEYLGK